MTTVLWLDVCIQFTAAQTLGATAHLTNVQFTDALLDPTSQAYQNLSRSIMEEVGDYHTTAALTNVF